MSFSSFYRADAGLALRSRHRGRMDGANSWIGSPGGPWVAFSMARSMSCAAADSRGSVVTPLPIAVKVLS
jgi:hypothetical protein